MPASDKQRTFAENLHREREIPEHVWNALREKMDSPSLMPRHISADFDAIIKANYPRRSRSAGGAPPAAAVEYPDWFQREKACYAFPVDGLPQETRDRLVRAGQDYLFFEVVERYEGKRRFCNKLTGAPGSFSRSKISAADQRVLWDALGVGNVQRNLSQLFGMIYSCCGVCKAELTDDLSRELHLGPVCRRRFGL